MKRRAPPTLCLSGEGHFGPGAACSQGRQEGRATAFAGVGFPTTRDTYPQHSLSPHR